MKAKLPTLGRLLAAIVLSATPLPAAANRPNLIVIVTDDHRYADVGFNGCQDIPTPHVDSITRNGVHFNNGYVTFPSC